VESTIVIEAMSTGEQFVLDIDSILVLQDKTILGRLFEVFGPVTKPFYSVLFNTEADIAQIPNATVGQHVFYVPNLAKIVFTEQLKFIKGSDASNIFDEEVAAEEMAFSDDEAEMMHKAKLKKKRKLQTPKADGKSFNQPKESNQKQTIQASGEVKTTDIYSPLISYPNPYIHQNVGAPQFYGYVGQQSHVGYVQGDYVQTTGIASQNYNGNHHQNAPYANYQSNAAPYANYQSNAAPYANYQSNAAPYANYQSNAAPYANYQSNAAPYANYQSNAAPYANFQLNTASNANCQANDALQHQDYAYGHPNQNEKKE
jgi:H/ACA ribonucleoprotein complex non-core subunit NAF1